MKRFTLLTVLLTLLWTLSACGAAPQAEKITVEDPATLEGLCGADYQDYIADTITMQMENRMDKTPDVVYFPIADSAHLTDYVPIDETTDFTVDEEGHIVILFPAGTVTDEANGEQSFRIPRP